MTVRVTGEIDIATAPALEALLDEHLGVVGGRTDLVVDLSEVTFLGVRGFAVLAAGADEARLRGTAFSVTGDNPYLARILATFPGSEPLIVAEPEPLTDGPETSSRRRDRVHRRFDGPPSAPPPELTATPIRFVAAARRSGLPGPG